jgi:hypothetical protein
MKPTAGVEPADSSQSKNAAELTKKSLDTSENQVTNPAVESK